MERNESRNLFCLHNPKLLRDAAEFGVKAGENGMRDFADFLRRFMRGFERIGNDGRFVVRKFYGQFFEFGIVLNAHGG